jgi:hypothetical protein
MHCAWAVSDVADTANVSKKSPEMILFNFDNLTVGAIVMPQ